LADFYVCTYFRGNFGKTANFAKIIVSPQIFAKILNTGANERARMKTIAGFSGKWKWFELFRENEILHFHENIKKHYRLNPSDDLN
jgi:hypothetical protein